MNLFQSLIGTFFLYTHNTNIDFTISASSRSFFLYPFCRPNPSRVTGSGRGDPILLYCFLRRILKEKLCQQCLWVQHCIGFSHCSKKVLFFSFLFWLIWETPIFIINFKFRIFRRNYLLKDVYDDMMLDGVKPTRDTFHSLVLGTMKGSRMQDAFFFLDQMKIMGLVPDVCTSGTCSLLLCECS